MRVVWTLPRFDKVVTGGQTYALETLNYLDRAQVHLMFLQKTDSPSRFIKGNRVLRNAWYACQFAKIPKGKDVVVLEDYSQRLDLLLLNLLIHITKRAKLACMTQVFYFNSRKSRLKDFLDLMISRLFFWPMDMVIASSATMAEDTATMMKVARHKLRVVYPPLRSEFGDSTVVSQSDHKERPKRLLFIGYLDPRKGIEYLMYALKLLEGQNLKVTIVGNSSVSPSYSRKIFTMVRELGLQQQIDFVEEVRDTKSLIALYQQADIFVLPSTYESFGIVLAEAMCLGLPIVASRVGGIPELVEDGVNGILVPPQNPQALAEAILTLIQKTSLRKEMGQNSYQRSFQWRYRKGEDVGKECCQALLGLTKE